MLRRLMLALSLTFIAAPALAHDDEPEDCDEGWEEEAEASHKAEAKVHRRDDGRSVAGDLTSKWFHIGGGFGGVGPGVVDDGAPTYGAGRFVLGSGGYTFLLYGGTELAITHTQVEPLRIEGAGFVGVAVPVPVFHPLIGIRGSIGGHFGTDKSFLPQVSVGPQAGFILRKFDGKPGLRLMIDGGANIRPVEQEIVPELFITLAGVF
jgi:hypothetical protein